MASTGISLAAEGSPIRWLVLGDSYSSGEGIPGTHPGNPKLQGKKDCVRADGINTEAKAWAVVAHEQAKAASSFSFSQPLFVACTGAITDDITTQLAEMRSRAGTPNQWDVISMSFGGNNIGFASILKGCLDINSGWGFFDLTRGCDVTYRDIADRVDMLVGKRPIDSSKFVGKVTLPNLYDQIAAAAAPGAQVFVTGYPGLIEDYSRWDYWRRTFTMNCEGIPFFDVAMLRKATDYLNQQTKLAAAAATTKWVQRGITFHWVDTAAVYETPTSRHLLCSKEPWLNGRTTGVSSWDIQIERSFHPKQLGHTALGAQVRKQLLDAWNAAPPRDETLSDSERQAIDLGGGKFQVSVLHPTWGKVRLVTYQDFEREVFGFDVFDSTGAKKYSWSVAYDLYDLRPKSGFAVDRLGHVFLTYSIGRPVAVIVLRPVEGGFEDFRSLPTSSGPGFFYDAFTTDDNSDGIFEILEQSDWICDPNCADGTVTTTTYEWNGSDYVER